MEKEQNISIIWCFSQSIALTFRNFFAFFGAAVIAFLFSILTLSLMFPCLMTGLENMYLRAKAGEQIKATDVFMHRRKWWSLYWDSVAIAWLVGWPIAAFSGATEILSILISQTLNPRSVAIIESSYIPMFLFLFVWSMFKESKHLHALNIAAEYELRGFESRHLSRLSAKSRWKYTLFVVLLTLLTPLFFLSAVLFYFSIKTTLSFLYPMIFTSIILLLLNLTMGATAMAFLHDLGEKKEILEMVKKYKEEYQRELSKEVENPCPTCGNSNVYKTQTEYGQGDWCPDCKLSLREMRGLA